jgi:polar amino acid transport system substrate-binding protein
MQKTSLILALALAFTPAVWAENVNINGTGVSIEANKTPVNTAKTAMRWHSCRRLSLCRTG